MTRQGQGVSNTEDPTPDARSPAAPTAPPGFGIAHGSLFPGSILNRLHDVLEKILLLGVAPLPAGPFQLAEPLLFLLLLLLQFLLSLLESEVLLGQGMAPLAEDMATAGRDARS